MATDLEVRDAPRPPTRGSHRSYWSVGGAVVVGLMIVGAWLLFDSTVPAGDYEAAVAELQATEVELASTRAEVAALTNEVASLTARIVQLDEELTAIRELDSAPVEDDPPLWFEEYDEARVRLFQARTERSTEFDLTSDSLCLWFTPEVMNDIVLVAQIDSGTRFDVEEFGSADCGQPPGSIARWSVSRTRDGSDEFRFSIELGRAAADYRQLPNRVEPADFVSPVLSWAAPPSSSSTEDPVTYGNLTYDSFYGAGVSVQLRVEGHEDDVLFFSLRVNDRESMMEPAPRWPSNRYEWFSYSVVNLMLEQMGWIDCPTTWCR